MVLSQYGVNPTGKATLTSQGGTGTKYGAGVTATLDAINPTRARPTPLPGQYLTPQLATLRTKASNYARYSTLSGPPPVTTSGLYAAYGSLTLKAGSTGPAVRDLQTELNRRGFNVGTADGVFGQMTTAGVTAFQKAARLQVVGRGRQRLEGALGPGLHDHRASRGDDRPGLRRRRTR